MKTNQGVILGRVQNLPCSKHTNEDEEGQNNFIFKPKLKMLGEGFFEI